MAREEKNFIKSARGAPRLSLYILEGDDAMKERINRLAISYKKTKDQMVFNELYTLLKSKWERQKTFDAFYTRTSESDVQAMYDDTLLRVIESFDEQDGLGNFCSMLDKSIKNAKKDLLKAEMRRRKRECLMTDDEDAATSEIADDYHLENDVVDRLKRKRDQRQLISFLIADVDDLTQRIVEHFPNYESITALGKALGLHHSVITRKLSRLARKYDRHRFGNISDYLAG